MTGKACQVTKLLYFDKLNCKDTTILLETSRSIYSINKIMYNNIINCIILPIMSIKIFILLKDLENSIYLMNKTLKTYYYSKHVQLAKHAYFVC